MWQLSQLQIIDSAPLGEGGRRRRKEKTKKKKKDKKEKKVMSFIARGWLSVTSHEVFLTSFLSEHFRGPENIWFVEAESRQNRAAQKYLSKFSN